MCRISKQYRPGCHPKIGYKTVIKRGKRYFSMFTGIEYKLGKVQLPDLAKPTNKIEMVADVLKGEFYRPHYKGLTAIFKELNSARTDRDGLLRRIETENCDPVKLVNLKIELGGIKYIGTYEYGEDHVADVFLGSVIRSIKEV